jgi:hypothetical protein
MEYLQSTGQRHALSLTFRNNQTIVHEAGHNLRIAPQCLAKQHRVSGGDQTRDPAQDADLGFAVSDRDRNHTGEVY